MGCGASRGKRSSRVGVDEDDRGAYSTEMLKRYNHKHSVNDLRTRDLELAQEIIGLRRHTTTERQRLIVRIAGVKDMAEAATKQLREEVHAQLGDFHGGEFSGLKWEVAAAASHISHIGTRLQDCREQRQVDQQQTANAIAQLRRDFTAQVTKLTGRVQASERFAMAAEAAQRRAEAEAAERAREAQDQRVASAAESAALAKQVERAVSEKLRAVETADMLFGMAEARAAAAEAAQRQAEDDLAKAVARTHEATETRKEAMQALHQNVVDSNLSTGRTQEAARSAASKVLETTRLKAQLTVAQQSRLRAEDEAQLQNTLRQKADANATQWAYRVAALEGREVVRELGVTLPQFAKALESSPLQDHIPTEHQKAFDGHAQTQKDRLDPRDIGESEQR